ncbi:MAG: CRISPR-associated helicase Cas3' [Candidatus Desantisbacteria bacterium]
MTNFCLLVGVNFRFIIEEITGGGKTEAALTLVHRLMADGLASGLFLGLPTMATANAIHKRVKAMYHSLFNNTSNPSLVLAHSTARMVLEMEEKNRVDRGYGTDEDSASQNCSAWLSDSRKKALLANVGVGTIDQALIAVLSARHQSLRLFGLCQKVLIVDEVHACDSYMLKLLGTLLRFHAAFGGSAILLSATLPQTIRAQLLKSFDLGANFSDIKPVSMAYPLLTCLSIHGLKEIPVVARKDTSRSVTVQHLHHIDEVVKQLQTVIEVGGCACWVRNTVYDAVEAYQQWTKSFGVEGVRLFHARFALGDRLQIEQDVLRLFGTESIAEDRRGQLLIATQVVEQSLDIDFDYMVCDLAPIDLVIQRAGRLKRHSRDLQGNRIKGKDERGETILGVLMPDALDNADKNWYKEMFPKAYAVYPHHGQLWLTAHWLQKQGRFSMPEDARVMIESVYGEDASQLVPDGLKKIEDSADGKDMANASMGRLNSLNLDKGYLSTMNQWQDDTIALTRLGEITMMVRLCRLVNGQIEPLFTGTGHDWELSQLSVRHVYVNKELPEFEAKIKVAKQAMPDKGCYCVLVPLELSGEKWIGKALNKQGEIIQLGYDNCIGLQIKGGKTDESD